MKTLALVLTLLLSAAAPAARATSVLADTVVELRPAGPVTGAYRWQCAATKFLNATTIGGVCQEKYYSPARYAQPKVVGTWVTTWDFSGNPTLTATPAVWPGCFTYTVVLVDGVPTYYIDADNLGNQLVENYCYSYLVDTAD